MYNDKYKTKDESQSGDFYVKLRRQFLKILTFFFQENGFNKCI